ncbi:hypothetical protein SAMN04515667_0093 [Formosa sp. Hel1_31_208]|uniref:hypothetical protein n=1 Tax=Formosa sp. Hel1_31_208 TaxID=1798225 RepID=UPI00087B0988|nr:hypothetical protein [Formosa sp. Hel1_31_208]SDR66210.1 hypothetical protein SAMN04515667_0093 [Formosa sp. Hel1_31_208]
MNTITKYVVLLTFCFITTSVTAQEKQKDSIIETSNAFKQMQINTLIETKKNIETQEREYLKAEVEAINKRLNDGKITADEAEQLKKEAAKKRAANIEDRLAIIDKRIELIKRNPYKEDLDSGNVSYIGFVTDSENGGRIGLSINTGNKTPPKYDIRTSNKLLFAIGINNTLIDGQSLDDSPYKIGGSGFVELGWVWSTRLLKDSNFFRLNYGFSFQWNKLNIKDNLYFVQDGNATTLQEFPLELNKSQFRVTNLVFPMHLEFGPSRKREYDNRIRYTTDNQFKVGIGAYGGFRVGTQQKLKYKVDGDRVKDKIRRNYNVSNFVYGLSAYVGFGDLALYAKYDLNPLFKDQTVEQNNISLGFRLDLD